MVEGEGVSSIQYGRKHVGSADINSAQLRLALCFNRLILLVQHICSTIQHGNHLSEHRSTNRRGAAHPTQHILVKTPAILRA